MIVLIVLITIGMVALMVKIVVDSCHHISAAMVQQLATRDKDLLAAFFQPLFVRRVKDRVFTFVRVPAVDDSASARSSNI